MTTVIGLAIVGVHTVRAQEAQQEQELEQRVEVQCQAGAYGQGQVCGVTTEQRARQEQRIVLRNGEAVAPHQVVSTAFDTQTIAVLAGLMAASALSTFGLIKTKQL